MKNREQKIDWSILLHDIRSVQNVASIFRMSEVFGVRKIYLSGVTPGPLDRFGREREDFLKISLGTEKTVSWSRVEEMEEIVEQKMAPPFSAPQFFIKEFQKQGGVVLALEQDEKSTDYKDYSIDMLKKYLLVPGQEREGLEIDILKLSDTVLEIPQYSQKESLNIFSATSILVARLFDR